MKKLIIKTAATLLVAQSASAIIVNDNDSPCLNHKGTLCALEITTSLPTLLVEGQAVDLGSQEASARLELEAGGLADKQIINFIAEDTGTSAATITAEVLRLKTQGQEVSVSAVVNALKNK